MLKLLIRRQWKRAFFLVSFFLGVLFLQIQVTTESPHYFVPFQHSYMDRFDLRQRDTFFAQLYTDLQSVEQTVAAIYNFDAYEGEIPEGELSDLDILSGISVSTINLDMALWRNQMLNSPGKFSNTIANDELVIRQLAFRLDNQENFGQILENQKEIMRRGIRRGGSKVIKYEMALTELKKINTDFDIADTWFTEQLFTFLENDWYILALISLSLFSVFSTANQEKITNCILISKLGIRRYTRLQLAASVVICIGCLIFYYTGAVFIYSLFNVQAIPWEMPIQAIVGYENILLSISVLDFFLLMAGMKFLFCFCVAGIVLLVSVVSRNTVIAVMGTLAVCGGLILMDAVIPATSGLAIGNCRVLVEELCFVNCSGILISHAVVYSAATIIFAVVIYSIVIMSSASVAKRRVK